MVISDPTRSDPTLPPIRPPDNLIADHSHYAPYGTINPPPIHQLVAIFALKQNTEISVFLLEQVYCMNTGVLYRRCALRKFSFLFSLSLRPTPYFKLIAWKNYRSRLRFCAIRLFHVSPPVQFTFRHWKNRSDSRFAIVQNDAKKPQYNF